MATLNMIDIENPIWLDLKNYIQETRRSALSTKNWYRYVAFFTKEHVELFPTICSDVAALGKKVITEIIKYHRNVRTQNELAIMRLNELAALWNYDYTEHNYIDVCLRHRMYKYNMLKYFVERGCTFENIHANYIKHFDTDVVNLMIEQGLDPNLLVSKLVKKMYKYENRDMQKLLEFAKMNLDIVGHILAGPEPSQKVYDSEDCSWESIPSSNEDDLIGDVNAITISKFDNGGSTSDVEDDVLSE
jgi:hypothetical protein